MGFWDDFSSKFDDVRRNIVWKAEEIVDSAKDVVSDIADGTMKENLQARFGTMEENKKELAEIINIEELKDDFKELVAQGVEEVKQKPFKSFAVIIPILAAPLLAVGMAGATAATLAQMVMVGGAAKVIEEIRGDKKLDEETKKVYIAAVNETEKKNKERIEKLQEVAKEYCDVTSTSLCVYFAMHGMLSQGKKILTKEEHTMATLWASGVISSERPLPPMLCKTIEQYREQALDFDDAKRIAVKSCGNQELVDKIFKETLKQFTTMAQEADEA